MISVCMATYNGEKYIKEQVDSILYQIGLDDELIVSDDGSTDKTLDILRSYSDDRIKIFNNDNRKGVVGNFENALIHAKGDYIFLSDQDDVWLEGKVKKCLRELQHYDLVVTDCFVTDQELNIISFSFFNDRKSRVGFWKNLYKNTYLGACIAFRADLLSIVLPIPKNLPVYHEGWIASIADLTGKVIFLDFPAIYFRRHSNNTSLTAKNKTLPISKQFKNRFILLWLVANRVFLKKYANRK